MALMQADKRVVGVNILAPEDHPFALSYAEVKELVRNSIEYSILPGDSLFVGHDYHKLPADFAGVDRPGWKPSPRAQRLVDASEKRRVQIRLEQAFAAFEN